MTAALVEGWKLENYVRSNVRKYFLGSSITYESKMWGESNVTKIVWKRVWL